ncbi:MAG: acyl-CoA thioesterase [Desulfobulbaceae bacterium]|nr:acyl-CoA thioesterase [Desulfobulbaceae bacterium]
MERHKATRIKVHGYHCDFYGHVNNARYLEFYEEDRWAWLDQAVDLRRWMAKGLTFAIVNINVNYRKSVVIGTAIEVRTSLEKIGEHSATLRQEIILLESGEIASDALITFVIADKNGRALAMKAEVEEVQELLSLIRAMSRPDANHQT